MTDKPTATPTLADLLDEARELYIHLSIYRVSPMIEVSEIEATEDAQKAASKIVADIQNIITARQNRAAAAS